MHIEIVLFEMFVDWLARSYGSRLKIHAEVRGDEFARGMVAGRFVVVRRPAGALEESEMLEVHCSDPAWLENVEKSWALHFMQILDKEDSSDGEPENN